MRMSVVYGNANYRRKFDAFRVIDVSGQEPLQNAIACALRLRLASDRAEKALDSDITPETRAQLTLALARAIPEEFKAWIDVAQFVYAKPKFVPGEQSPEDSKLNAEAAFQIIKQLEADSAHGSKPV